MKKFDARLSLTTNIMKKYFVDPNYCLEKENALIFRTECICNKTLPLILSGMNKAMAEQSYPIVFKNKPKPFTTEEAAAEAAVRFIRAQWIEIWDDVTPNNATMNCITQQAIKNNIPHDELSNIHLGDIDELRRNTEDAFGLSCDEYEIDIKVEAIAYQWADIWGEFEEYPPEEVPCLWCYTGHFGSFTFHGLASTSGLAIGKAIKAIYRRAKSTGYPGNEYVALELESNRVKWYRYGYCY